MGVFPAAVRPRGLRSVKATEEVQFVINWRNDVTTAHIIRYKGVLYDITRVDTFEGYKNDLTLYCKKKT